MKITRRQFIGGTAAVTAGAGLFSFNMLAKSDFVHAESNQAGVKTFRNVCPRNCYDTCAQISYVEDGVLKKVEGDPKSTYTNGKLCLKGYNYTRRVYSPDRIKYPMKQTPRGSGNWERISWDEAMNTIAEKILSLKNVTVLLFPSVWINTPATLGSPTTVLKEPCLVLATPRER